MAKGKMTLFKPKIQRKSTSLYQVCEEKQKTSWNVTKAAFTHIYSTSILESNSSEISAEVGSEYHFIQTCVHTSSVMAPLHVYPRIAWSSNCGIYHLQNWTQQCNLSLPKRDAGSMSSGSLERMAPINFGYGLWLPLTKQKLIIPIWSNIVL